MPRQDRPGWKQKEAAMVDQIPEPRPAAPDRSRMPPPQDSRTIVAPERTSNAIYAVLAVIVVALVLIYAIFWSGRDETPAAPVPPVAETPAAPVAETPPAADLPAASVAEQPAAPAADAPVAPDSPNAPAAPAANGN
jgi:hypothetical protein